MSDEGVSEAGPLPGQVQVRSSITGRILSGTIFNAGPFPAIQMSGTLPETSPSYRDDLLDLSASERNALMQGDWSGLDDEEESPRRRRRPVPSPVTMGMLQYACDSQGRPPHHGYILTFPIVAPMRGGDDNISEQRSLPLRSFQLRAILIHNDATRRDELAWEYTGPVLVTGSRGYGVEERDRQLLDRVTRDRDHLAQEAARLRMENTKLREALGCAPSSSDAPALGGSRFQG